MKLTGVCLITHDVPALANFYAKVLGVKAEGDAIHTELHTEGTGIAIFSVAGMESMATGSMAGAGCGNFTLMFEVEDVDVEYERLKAYDIVFVKPPQTHPWGSRTHPRIRSRAPRDNHRPVPWLDSANVH